MPQEPATVPQRPPSNDIDLDAAIEQLRQKKGVPKALFDRLMQQESGGDDSAVSPKGAAGRMQVMPATFDLYNKRVGGVLDPNSPLDRAYVGLSLLADNYKQFRPLAKTEQHAWGMALAGYHGSSANVLADIKRGGNGIPSQDDGLINTRDYVYNILSGTKPEDFTPQVTAETQTQADEGIDMSPEGEAILRIGKPVPKPAITSLPHYSDGSPAAAPSQGMQMTIPIRPNDTIEDIYRSAYTRTLTHFGFDAAKADEIGAQLAAKQVAKTKGNVFHAGTNQPLDANTLAAFRAQGSTTFSFDDPENIADISAAIQQNKPALQKVTEMALAAAHMGGDPQTEFMAGATAKAAAGWLDVYAGEARTEEAIANAIREHQGKPPLRGGLIGRQLERQARALREGTEASSASMSAPEQYAQNTTAGFIETAPLMLAGGPAGAAVAFGAHSALKTAGQGGTPMQIATEGGKAAIIGAALGAEGGAGVPNAILKAGTLGAGTFALESATGVPKRQALESAASVAGMSMFGSFMHSQFGKVRETESQANVPKGKIRVVDESGGEHVIIKPSSVRNQRAVPIRSEAAAETVPEASAGRDAVPAREPASTVPTRVPVEPVAAQPAAQGETGRDKPYPDNAAERSVQDSYWKLNDLFMERRNSGREEDAPAQEALGLLEGLENTMSSGATKHRGLSVEFQNTWQREAESIISQLERESGPPPVPNNSPAPQPQIEGKGAATDIESWKKTLTPERSKEVQEYEDLRYKTVASQGREAGYKPYKLTAKERARLADLDQKYGGQYRTSITPDNWRDVFDQSTDPFRKNDILRVAARFKNPQELAEVLDRAERLKPELGPSLSNLFHDVSLNPAATPEIKQRATRLDDESTAAAEPQIEQPAPTGPPARETVQHFVAIKDAVGKGDAATVSRLLDDAGITDADIAAHANKGVPNEQSTIPTRQATGKTDQQVAPQREGKAAEDVVTVSTGDSPPARFSAARGRLAAMEAESRAALKESAESFAKLKAEKGGELGATTIPTDLYHYSVIMASKMAQKTLTLAEFTEAALKEFGEAVREHIQKLYRMSKDLVASTERAVRDDEFQGQVADRLFTDSVPREQQEKLLRTAQMYRTTTDTQGKLLAGFKSRVAVMAQSYGEAGGELTNRLHLGDILRAHLMDAGNQFLNKVQDVYGGVKNDFERNRINDSVIKALENRANADTYLDTPEKRTVYDNTVAMLDMFKAKLDALGYGTRDDYFTHIRDVDVLDQILNDTKDPRDINLNELILAKSSFLKPRTDADIQINKNLPRVLFTYLKSVTRELAYKDAVEYYYDQFPNDIPPALRRNSMDRAMKAMQNSLQPEQGKGVGYRIANFLRSQQYRNFLALNLKASAQNFTQVDFAKMRWTPEATRLVGRVWRNREALTGPLADAVQVASTKETPMMRFLEQWKGDDPAKSPSSLSEMLNSIDTFQKSEGRNWGMSEVGSIINSVVKRPEYAAMKAEMGEVPAISELLKQQDVFDAAVREAAVTAAETQVAANPAMRGEFYDAPLHRIIGMFTAFKTRQLQVLAETLGRQEGVNGTRSQMILRRGLSGDAKPVEVLREVESNRRAMETMLKKADKFNEDLGVPREQVRDIIAHLKTQEADLNGIIKQIEPGGGSGARRAAMVGKYFAKVGAISVFFNVFWGLADSAIGGDDKTDEERLSTALTHAFWDVLPSPFYGMDASKFLVSPLAPNLERSSSFGHLTRRGVTKDVVGYGTSVLPYIGLADRISGKRISGAVVDVLAPKKDASTVPPRPTATPTNPPRR